MVEELETCQIPSENSSKIFRQAEIFLSFFGIDISQWNKIRVIKWIMLRLALLIIILGFGFYTAKTGWALLMDYAQSPTSFTQRAMLNESIALPASVVCLPLNPFELDDYWANSDTLSSSDHAAHYKKLLTDYFDNKTVTKDILLTAKKPWPNFLLFVVDYYLYNIIMFETLNEKQTVEYIKFSNSSYNSIATTITILDDQLSILNISAYELKLKYGSEVESLFNLTMIHFDRSSGKTVKVKVATYFYSFEPDYICYIANFDQHQLRKGEAVLFQAERSTLPNPRPAFDNMVNMKIGIGGKLSFGLYDAYISAPFDSWIYYYSVRVVSTFKTISSIGGEQRCNENKTYEQCTAKCRRDYIREKCHCCPTSGQKGTAYKEEVACTLKTYMTCFDEENRLNNEDAQRHLIGCEDDCVDICERTTYFIPQGSDDGYSPGNPFYEQINCSMIELTMANFDYPIFEETLKWTFPSFIGVLGGALGLWLGLNIWDSVVYLIKGIKILNQARERRKKTMNAVPTEVAKHFENSDSNDDTCRRITALRRRRNMLATKDFCTVCVKISKKLLFVQFLGLLLRMVLGFLSLLIIGVALREYRNQSTTTTVNVEHKDAIAIPDASICLSFSFGELGGLSFYNKKTIDHRLNGYLNDQSMTKDDFLPKSRRWDNIVRNVVHAYLIDFSSCEIGYYSNCNRAFARYYNLTAAVIVLEKIIVKLNISTNELRQRFGEEVAVFYSFSVSLWDYYEYVKDIDIIRANYVGLYEICYEIPFNIFSLKRNNYFQLVLSEYSLPNSYYFGSYRNKINIDFGNRLSTDEYGSESFLSIEFGTVTTYPVALTKYRMLREINGGKMCSELTLDQCESVSRMKYIYDQCKCMPTSWPSLQKYINSTITDICDMEKYELCLDGRGIWQPEQLASHCHRPCERLTVEVKEMTYYYSSSNETYIRIILDNMNLLTFDERLAWRRENLFEITGGVVGFLLGYSLLDMLCFAFLSLNRTFMTVLKKGKEFLLKKSQVTVIQVKPALNVLAVGMEQNGENAGGNNTNLMSRFKKIGWNIDNLEWIIVHVFKLAMIAYFGYLTVKMCIPIILKFKEGNTTFVITLVLNEPFYLKPATLCIGVYPEELDDMIQLDAANLSEIKYQDEVKTYFNQSNITKESFLDGIKWTRTLLFITYKYLLTLSLLETAAGYIKHDLTVPYYFETIGKDLYVAQILLENTMNELNISATELRQRVGQEVTAIFSLNAYQTTNCQGYADCQHETKIPTVEVTLIDKIRICYQMPFRNYSFRNPKESFVITANSNSLPNKNKNERNRYLEIYLQGRNGTSLGSFLSESKYFASVIFDAEQQVSVGVSEMYQSLSSLGKCNKYKTVENCLSECRIDLFQQMCNCTPTTWSSLTSLEMYRECKLSDYTFCLNYTGHDDDLCVKKNCDTLGDLCERWIYNIQYLERKYSYNGTRLILQIASFDYPIFIEQYELSFEEFTGAIGGAISFYLGLDFFRILLIFYKILSFLGSLFTGFKKNNVESSVRN